MAETNSYRIILPFIYLHMCCTKVIVAKTNIFFREIILKHPNSSAVQIEFVARSATNCTNGNYKSTGGLPRVCSRLSPGGSWDWLQHPPRHKSKRWLLYDRWMDGIANAKYNMYIICLMEIHKKFYACMRKLQPFFAFTGHVTCFSCLRWHPMECRTQIWTCNLEQKLTLRIDLQKYKLSC